MLGRIWGVRKTPYEHGVSESCGWQAFGSRGALEGAQGN